VRVTVQNVRDWHVELKMRKLPKPVRFEGARMISELVDEIIWKDPPSPMPGALMYEGLRFRVLLPNTPGLPEKLGRFMRATATPVPFIILVTPKGPEYPWVLPAEATRPGAKP
jgi:hypothetical protein